MNIANRRHLLIDEDIQPFISEERYHNNRYGFGISHLHYDFFVDFLTYKVIDWAEHHGDKPFVDGGDELNAFLKDIRVLPLENSVVNELNGICGPLVLENNENYNDHWIHCFRFYGDAPSLYNTKENEGICISWLSTDSYLNKGVFHLVDFYSNFFDAIKETAQANLKDCVSNADEANECYQIIKETEKHVRERAVDIARLYPNIKDIPSFIKGIELCLFAAKLPEKLGIGLHNFKKDAEKQKAKDTEIKELKAEVKELQAQGKISDKNALKHFSYGVVLTLFLFVLSQALQLI